MLNSKIIFFLRIISRYVLLQYTARWGSCEAAATSRTRRTMASALRGPAPTTCAHYIARAPVICATPSRVSARRPYCHWRPSWLPFWRYRVCCCRARLSLASLILPNNWSNRTNRWRESESIQPSSSSRRTDRSYIEIRD